MSWFAVNNNCINNAHRIAFAHTRTHFVPVCTFDEGGRERERDCGRGNKKNNKYKTFGEDKTWFKIGITEFH